ncbi:hypothetical protein [Methylobacterium sp. 37f]|uniref:hypothetical protein n=1 Tax=Methylobacterium sp. 37f TaxID=2817058 RepID=UPI001FFC3BAD|nr:hypothetical protein [Methylobacterium sp. 37f]MCK2056634.1 hypothetical protein [Methylobacterium sp. 37f]
MLTSTHAIKIRNKTFYYKHYGRANSTERRDAWRSIKQIHAAEYPASVIIDDRVASVGSGGRIVISDEAFKWLAENCVTTVCVNHIAMMLGFADEEDALAFQIRFLS